MKEPLSLASCTKEAMIKKREINVIARIKPLVLLTLMIVAGYAYKITPTRR